MLNSWFFQFDCTGPCAGQTWCWGRGLTPASQRGDRSALKFVLRWLLSWEGGRGGFTGAKVSAVTKLITFFWLLLTLYSCGNVIVLVTVHFINNWFMMILVAVYVYLKINAMKSPWLWRDANRTDAVWNHHRAHCVHRLPFCLSRVSSKMLRSKNQEALNCEDVNF